MVHIKRSPETIGQAIRGLADDRDHPLWTRGLLPEHWLQIPEFKPVDKQWIYGRGGALPFTGLCAVDGSCLDPVRRLHVPRARVAREAWVYQ